MQNITTTQTSPEVQININFAALAHCAMFSQDPTTSGGLTWGYLGGPWEGTVLVDSTLALTASSDNYIVVELATGVVTSDVTTTNWDSSAYARLYKVTTDGSGVTDVFDYRVSPGGLLLAPPAGGANPAVALTPGASIAVDLSLGDNLAVTLTSNSTLQAPTSPVDGQRWRLLIRQSGGPWTLAFNSKYRFPNSESRLISTSTTAIDIMECWYDSTADAHFCRLGNDYAP